MVGVYIKVMLSYLDNKLTDLSLESMAFYMTKCPKNLEKMHLSLKCNPPFYNFHFTLTKTGNKFTPYGIVQFGETIWKEIKIPKLSIDMKCILILAILI